MYMYMERKLIYLDWFTWCWETLYLLQNMYSCMPDRIFQWFTDAGKRMTRRHISWCHGVLINECCCNIYEWMCKFIRYYKNIVHSLTQTLKPFVPIFILKIICKKKKLSLVTDMDGNFRLSSDCFCSTSAEVPLKDSYNHISCIYSGNWRKWYIEYLEHNMNVPENTNTGIHVLSSVEFPYIACRKSIIFFFTWPFKVIFCYFYKPFPDWMV